MNSQHFSMPRRFAVHHRGRCPAWPRRQLLASAIATALAVTPAWSDVTPANGNTTLFNHPSGVPVVNIAQPNASGLSHNQYTAFDVPAQGMVLNNATSVTMSQLAGSVPVNANLNGRSASIILNEVIAPRRSLLSGFLEVAGQQADVIIANPYGITCQGCGFINTPRVTLSTGAPSFASDGSLSGFLVNAGDVLINGSGLDASRQNILDIVARSVLLDGQVNGADVQVVTGNNDFDYAARTATAQATTGTGPSYAIDSTVLGGLYANRIRLIATENNVGVRMLGDVAATADDLVLTSAGRIELRNKASAAHDITLGYTGASDAGAITVGGTGNSLAAGNDLSVSGGGLILEGGKLGAGANLQLVVDSLQDSGAGQRFSGGVLSINSGTAVFNGGSWDAGSNLVLVADNLTVTGSGTAFYAGHDNEPGSLLSLTTRSGDLALGSATLKNSGSINLASAAGLSLGAGGSVQSGRDLNLSAVTVLQSSGQLRAQDNITLRSGATAASPTMTATLGGEVRAGQQVNIAGAGSTPDKAIDLTVSGTVVGDTLQVKAEDVVISGLLQGSSGTQLAADTLGIGTGARLVASDTDGVAARLAVGSLSNSGYLQSKSRLNLDVGNQLNNNSGGYLLSGSDIVIRSSNAGGNLVVTNAGTLQSGAPASGTTLLAGTFIDIAGYDNGSAVNSAVDFSNSGNVYADALDFRMNTLTNSGLLASVSGADIRVQGAVNNNGSAARILLSQTAADTGSLQFSTLANQGSIESQGLMTLLAGSSIDNNGGKILGNAAVTVHAADASTVTFTNQNGGVVQAAGLLEIGGQGASGHNINVGNAGTLTGQQLVLNALTANNSGTIQAGSVSGGVYSKTVGNTVTLEVSTFNNLLASATLIGYDTTVTADTISNQGVIHASHALNLTAAQINNGSTGGISGLGSATLSATRSVSGVANDLNNYGLILSNADLNLTAVSAIHNYGYDASNRGQFYSTGNMVLNAYSVLNQGLLESKGDISISARTIDNSIADPGKQWQLTAYERIYEGDSGRYGGTHNGRWGWTDEGNGHFPLGTYIVLGIGYRLYEDFRGSYQFTEAFNSALSSLRPQMLATNINLSGFDNAYNTGGLLSASNNITLTGNGNANFINHSLDLYQQSTTYTGRRVYNCGYLGDAACADTAIAAPSRSYLQDDSYTTVPGAITRVGGIDAGLRAGGTITVNVAHIDNSGSPYPVTQSVGAYTPAGNRTGGGNGSGSSGFVGGGGSVNLGGGDHVGLGLDLSLPASPNGFFVQTRDPSSAYLIETNPLFGLDAAYLGSEYLAVKLGIPTDTLQRRLGDAAYENYLIRQQLIAQTGVNLIAGFTREADQTQVLLDNAVSEAGRLGLVFGKALTEEQVNALDEDIVWAVEQVVSGQKVLVPVVYLSRATLSGARHGAVIAATDIHTDGTTFTNSGGTVAASGSMTIVATDDIRNIAATLTAADMALVSTSGKVINETTVTRYGNADNYQDVASNTGSITATHNLVISGQKGVDIIGAMVSAGDSAVIHSASGDINITSLALESKSTTEKHENGLFSSHDEKTVETDQTRLASSVTVGDGKNTDAQLTLLTEKGDVNLLSADVASSGGINVMARDINSSALNLESSRTHSESSSGISSSGGALTMGSSASSSAASSSVGVGSALVAGGALNMLATGDIVLEGGSYSANTVSLDAGNVITKAAKNTYYSSSASSSFGVTLGNGSISAGSQSASASLDVTQHANAQIVAADGISIVAKKTVDIGGLDAAVLNKAPTTEASADEAASAESSLAEAAAAEKPKAPAPGLDVAALRAAVAGGTTADFIAGSSHDGLGAGAAMADMAQAATGQLAISGENIVSTKYKDEYRHTSESASTYVGIGVTSGGTASGGIAPGSATAVRGLSKEPASGGAAPKLALAKSAALDGVAIEKGASGKTAEGGSVGIGFSVGSSYSKESTSEKRDGINSLSADNIVLNGKKGIDLKGVAIVGGSSVSLKSDGDITISAAEVEKQHSQESFSTHLDVGTTFSAGADKDPLNVTGPVEAQATLGFGLQTHSLDESSKGHVDSLLSSGGALSIESTNGDVKWTGVTAAADALDIKANNFSSAAYQDSAKVSESSNSLGINLSVGTDVGKMASSLFQGNGSKSTTLQRSSTDEVGNTIAAGSVNIAVKDNVTLVGGNLVADSVSIKANTVDIKAEKSTLDEHKTEVGVSLVMDGSASFQGDKAWASVDSFTGKTETGTSQGGGLAERTGDGRVNNGKAVSDELLSGRTGLSITSTEETTKGESYRNANLQFNQLTIDTTATPGSTRGDGHVDIGGANLLGSGAGSSIGIVTGELKTTKYVDRQEVTSHDNSTFIGVAVEGHSAIADTMNHEKTLQDKVAQGMTLDENWVAAQRAADASNMAMGDAVGGSVAATVRNIDTQMHSLSTSENITYLNADNISIKTTQGNIALHGVEFNAPPVYNKDTGNMDKATGPRAKSISLDSAKDISLTAAKSTYSETSTTLTNDFNVTGSGSVSGSGSGVGVDVGYNGSIDKESLDRTMYSNASLAADNVSITSKNLSLTGANVSGGNVKVDVEKDIRISSVQDTQTQSTTRGNWGGSVGLNTTTVVSGNAQGGGGESHDNYAKTTQQSGITAEKNLDVSAGGNLTLTGAKLASGGTGSVSVKGDLTVNKLDDTHEKDGLFAGASGGINQGGVNAGINLEKVDQIHNATTQNSTISGVGLGVGGATRGDNLKADGSLQTQSTTVLKDEKIAGIYVNGTGVVTKSGVKKAASVVTSGAKAVTTAVMPSKPAPSRSATTEKSGEAVTAKSPAEGPAAATRAVPDSGKKYDSAVAVVTREKDGSIDPAVQKSVDAIKASHPDTIVVTADRSGKIVEGADQIASAKGNVRVDVIDHGVTLREQGPEKTATLIRNVTDEVARNPQVKETRRVELVACGEGACSVSSKSDKQTLGQEVTRILAKPGLEVAEHNTPIQVQADGSRVAESGSGAQKLVSRYAPETGVTTESRNKREDELVPALDPSRELGPPGAELVKQSSKILVRSLSGVSSSTAAVKLPAAAATPLTASVRRSSLAASAPGFTQKREKHMAASGSLKSFFDEKKMQPDLAKLTEPTMVSTYDSREQALKQNPNLPAVESALRADGHDVAYGIDITRSHESTPASDDMKKRADEKKIDMGVVETNFLRSMEETPDADRQLIERTAASLGKTPEVRTYKAVHTAFPDVNPKAPGSEVYKKAFEDSPLVFVQTKTIERQGTVESVPRGSDGANTNKMTVKKAEMSVFERQQDAPKYDGAVAVVTRERDGTVDSASRKAAEAIKAKYPETKIVEADRDGNIVKGGEQLDDVKGSVRVDMIDHGDRMRKQGADKVTALARNVTERIEANPHETDVKRLELVACGEGSCSVKKKTGPTLGAEVASSLAKPGLHVVEHDSPIQVQEHGVRVAQESDHGKTVHNVFSKEKGVEVNAREKRADEQVAALDPAKKLGKSDDESSDAGKSDGEEEMKHRSDGDEESNKESDGEESDHEVAPPSTVSLANAKSGAAPGFFRVGGKQSETLYRLAPDHEHSSAPGVVARSDAAAIPRPPRSFAAEPLVQTQRHLATVVDTFLRKDPGIRGEHQEVQVAVDTETGALVISTNTPAGNAILRKKMEALKKYMAASSRSRSSARQTRHHNKLMGELSPEDLAKITVIPIEKEGIDDGLHAERRLADAGYSDPHGTMRPCATCYGNLNEGTVDDLTRTGPGKVWVSKSANAKDGGAKVSNHRTRVTVGRDQKFHHDYGSESDSADTGKTNYPRKPEFNKKAAEKTPPPSSSSSSVARGAGADIYGNLYDAEGRVIRSEKKTLRESSLHEEHEQVRRTSRLDKKVHQKSETESSGEESDMEGRDMEESDND